MLPAAAPSGLPSREELEREKLLNENAKLSAESLKLRRESARWWRLLQAIGLFAPAATILLGVLSFLHIYNQGTADSFRKLLQELSADKPQARLGAVSRLAAEVQPVGPLGIFTERLPSAIPHHQKRNDVIRAAVAALRLEDNVHVKRETLRLLEALGTDSQRPLQWLRLDLITLLKAENTSKPADYWSNARETLFYVALTLSRVEGAPPDFRCFPLRGFAFRLISLSRARFDGATLAKVELWGGSVRDSSFRDANLFQATIRDLDLHGTSFEGAELMGATIGPNLTNIEPTAFRNSNWARVKSFQPPLLKQRLRRMLAPATGADRHGRDRDELCNALINQDFAVRP
jgi:hypothetical protein